MTRSLAPAGIRGPDWWRGAVIYQLDVRSFLDNSAIFARLDHIAKLGVDAIWLPPFFTSPMKGCDLPMKGHNNGVSAHWGVNPLFGSLEEVDRLLEAAHVKGLKVIIDQALLHTSDQHAWFQQSRDSHDNSKSDWYVWADAKNDGSPPNNWLSVFGGSAWQWDSRRGQYYLHSFLANQPNLNFHIPKVQDAALDSARFWLERGVDGLRLAAINFCIHDAELRDNPPAPVTEAPIDACPDNPYDFQRHVYDKSRPENLLFLERLRSLFDEYPGTTSIGEVCDDNALAVIADYTKGEKRLHMCYSPSLLTERSDPEFLHHALTSMESKLGAGWPCWAIGDHDVVRVASRRQADENEAAPRLYLAFLLTQRGSVCLYRDEELDLGKEWGLPAYRDFIAFRHKHPALVKGDVHYHRPINGVLCLERIYLSNNREERLLIALNFSSAPRELSAPITATAIPVPTLINGRWQAGRLFLPAYGIAIAYCSKEAVWDI